MQDYKAVQIRTGGVDVELLMDGTAGDYVELGSGLDRIVAGQRVSVAGCGATKGFGIGVECGAGASSPVRPWLPRSRIRLPELKPLWLLIRHVHAPRVKVEHAHLERRVKLQRIPGDASAFRLDPGHAVGPLGIHIVAGKDELTLRLFIRADKLGDDHTLAAVVDVVAADHIDRAVQRDSLTQVHLQAKPSAGMQKTPLQRLLHLEHWATAKGLLAALEQLERKPHGRVLREARVVPSGHARQPDAARMATFVSNGTQVFLRATTRPERRRYARSRRLALGFRSVPDSCVSVDEDTPPNRFLKMALIRFASIAQSVERDLDATGADDHGEQGQPTELIRDARERATRLRHAFARALRRPWMDEVALPHGLDLQSSVLHGDERYRVAVEAYLNLRLPLSLGEDECRLLMAPLAYMYELYEQWCRIQIVETLRNLGFRFEPAAPENDGGLQYKAVRARERAELHCRLSAPKYSRGSGLRSWSHPFRPDFALRWSRSADSAADAWFLMDAKYRLRRANGEGDSEYQVSDLDKMHTYRDALQGADGSGGCVRWVVALYPGDKTEYYLAGGDAKPRTSVNSTDQGVGAVAVRPGNVVAMKEFLRSVLSSSDSV